MPWGHCCLGASGVSFAAWVNADSTNAALGDNCILSVRGNPAASFVRLGLEQTSGRSMCRRRVGLLALMAINRPKAPRNAVSTGAWVHTGGVLDYPADQIRVYKDGQLDVTTSVTFGNNTYTFSRGGGLNDEIGGVANIAVPTSTATQFDGRIAELAVWAGKLTDGDFAQLWRPGGLRRASVPRCWWPTGRSFGYAHRSLRSSSGRVGTIGGTARESRPPPDGLLARSRIYVPRRRGRSVGAHHRGRNAHHERPSGSRKNELSPLEGKPLANTLTVSDPTVHARPAPLV